MRRQKSSWEAWIMLIVLIVITGFTIWLAVQRTYGCMELLHLDFWKCYAITHPAR